MMGLGGLAFKKSAVLADLTGVHVKVVIQNSKELEKYSSTLTEQHLRTKVESILRRRHIKVLSSDALPSVPGKPVLDVMVNPAIDKQLSMVAIHLRLQLTEDISLIKNNDIRIRAGIWARSGPILANFEELEIIGETVEKLTISFCDRYDEANPRPAVDTKDQVKDSKKDAKKNSAEWPPQKIIERN
jgi:hypothetical protein